MKKLQCSYIEADGRSYCGYVLKFVVVLVNSESLRAGLYGIVMDHETGGVGLVHSRDITVCESSR